MLEFVRTVTRKKIAKYSYIIVQEYVNEKDESIYNASIEESEEGYISITTDLFESKDLTKVLSYYKVLVTIYNYGKKSKKYYKE